MLSGYYRGGTVVADLFHSMKGGMLMVTYGDLFAYTAVLIALAELILVVSRKH